jgi:hypothetical protein
LDILDPTNALAAVSSLSPLVYENCFQIAAATFALVMLLLSQLPMFSDASSKPDSTGSDSKTKGATNNPYKHVFQDPFLLCFVVLLMKKIKEEQVTY